MGAHIEPILKPRPQGSEGKSPFRYPGGKAFLLPEIAQAIAACTRPVKAYAEPFAGGAGAAVELLARNLTEEIYLNDADIRVYAAWKAILEETDRFVDCVANAPLDINTWYKMREIVINADEKASFELGFATFYLNRTNRSGIVVGAGPIGGYRQAGEWTLGARFYRETMIGRVNWLGRHRDKISISNLDASDFIRGFSPKKARETFFFIDPPYVKAGGKLYLNSLDPASHVKLARLVRRKTSMCNWYMTYDYHPLIIKEYAFASVTSNFIRYSLHVKRTEKELVIRPKAA